MDWVWLFVVRRGDVLSAWCGIRPLVSDPNKKDTQSVARNHIIEVAADNLITIAGKNPPTLPSQHKMNPVWNHIIEVVADNPSLYQVKINIQ